MLLRRRESLALRDTVLTERAVGLRAQLFLLADVKFVPLRKMNERCFDGSLQISRLRLFRTVCHMYMSRESTRCALRST
jgi:hypothetical protein